jgi:hypothetical protein
LYRGGLALDGAVVAAPRLEAAFAGRRADALGRRRLTPIAAALFAIGAVRATAGRDAPQSSTCEHRR